MTKMAGKSECCPMTHIIPPLEVFRRPPPGDRLSDLRGEFLSNCCCISRVQRGAPTVITRVCTLFSCSGVPHNPSSSQQALPGVRPQKNGHYFLVFLYQFSKNPPPPKSSSQYDKTSTRYVRTYSEDAFLLSPPPQRTFCSTLPRYTRVSRFDMLGLTSYTQHCRLQQQQQQCARRTDH